MHQSYRQIEIILVDDGSTDGSSLLCKEVALTDKRIKVIQQTNQGLSVARNTGIAYAKGEYIAFVDGDDLVHQDYIQNLYDVIDEAEISVCRLQKFTDVKAISLNAPLPYTIQSLTGREANDRLFHHDLGLHMAVVTNKLFKKTLWENFKFPIGVLHEDIAIIYKILDQVERIQYINCPLYLYRQRDNSITTQRTFKSLADEYQALTDQTFFFQDRQQFSAVRDANRSRKSLFLLDAFPQDWQVWVDYKISDIFRDDLRTKTKMRLLLKKLSPRLFHRFVK